MNRKILKIFGVLLIMEAVLFIGMILTSMTDERPPAIAHYFYWVLKYIFGFPLVLIHSEFPFFLDSHEFQVSAIFMTILNNLILAGGIHLFIKFIFKKNGA